jgi:hypothetical protein
MFVSAGAKCPSSFAGWIEKHPAAFFCKIAQRFAKQVLPVASSSAKQLS